MQHCGTVDHSAADRNAALPKSTPLFARFLSKLVLEVLPASAASVIGAALLAHYHFGHPAAPAGGTATIAPAPASPEMLQLVRDEHDLIRNLIIAQQAAQANRYAAADAGPAQATATATATATADAAAADAAAHRAALALAAKALAAHVKVAATASPPLMAAPAGAAAVPAIAPAPQPQPALAGLQNSAAPSAIAPEHRSLMAKLLAVKDHVVRAPLHAVMTIGGIPSWIGHRLGSDEPDQSEQMFSAAS